MSAKVKRGARPAGDALRIPGWYHDHIWIAQRQSPPIESALNSLFPRVDVRWALSSGAPEGAQPQSLGIDARASDGQMLTFAKLRALVLIASGIVANEAQVLNRLARIPYVSGAVPQLIFNEEVDGVHVLAQTPLQGNPAPIGLSNAHRRFLDSLMTPLSVPAAQTATVTELPERLYSLPEARSDLLAAYERALPVLQGFDVPITIVHGDFAPWNLRLHFGNIGAFDWEYGQPHGLPLIDEIHYCLQYGWLLEDWGTDEAMDYLRRLCQQRPYGLLPLEVKAIVTIYLLDALARLLGEGYTRGQDVIEWHQRLLDRLVAPPPSQKEAAAA